MAEEAVIFPNRPLFMVDRGWQRSKKKTLPSSKPAKYEKQLDLQPSRVPEVSITVAKLPKGVTPVAKSEGKERRMPIRQDHAQPTPIKFEKYEPPTARRSPRKARKEHTKEGQTRPEAVAGDGNSAGPGFSYQDFLALKMVLPGTATALFSVLDPEVSSFHEFLTFYPTVVATSMYPISKTVPLTYNPIETIWFPAVLKDPVALHAILFSSAMLYFLSAGQATFKDSDLLMKIILRELNHRVQRGNYSDLTIGAISCLALCDSHLGNHDRWKMHASGMSEMVRARGGFGTIEDVLHAKIYRADTIGAVDTLSPPNFPRPIRVTKTLYATMKLKITTPPVKALLVDLGLTKSVLDALMELGYLCHTLNLAASEKMTISPLPFDEDVTCIQHDLLRSLSPTQDSVEKLCAITTLIFVQTLTREIPFTKRCSSDISKQLKDNFPAINVAKAPARLIFWMLFMGGLVSVDTEEKLWFRERLRDFRQLRGDLKTWESVEAELQKVFWVDQALEGFGLDLWQDISHCNEQTQT